ncbi:MAG: site-specific integrase [Steroidobacteraceae bacterium]
MNARRPHINRVLTRATEAAATPAREPTDIEAPRKAGSTLVEFSRLPLPPAVRQAFAEAFWSQERARAEATLHSYWHSLKSFGRFAAETGAVGSIADLNSTMIVRYIEWLNRQVRADGTPWHISTRASAYSGISRLLRWLQRCRPQLLPRIDFPHRAFPGQRNASRRIAPLAVPTLRAILKACEEDITALRALRERGARELALARTTRSGKVRTLGEVLLYVEERFGGIMPPVLSLEGELDRAATDALGGYRLIEPCLYPRPESIYPYYLAILIQSAGNPMAIAHIRVDCLQPIPLLSDRELLVWAKGRSDRLQRRSFRTTDPFAPPTLVREISEWTQRLRPHLPPAYRSRLFAYKGHRGIYPLSGEVVKKFRERFRSQHGLPSFALSAIRPGVLSAFYRVSGSLHEVKEIANHAHISTTEDYVRGPEVRSHNQARMCAIQEAYLAQIQRQRSSGSDDPPGNPEQPADSSAPRGRAVSLFGFDCKDPFAGIAPGTRAGELCAHFLGCFTCPNAVITADPNSIARLLQARDHLRAATNYLHPARWEAIYAPQLRILEEDILTRFSARELAAAVPLRARLAPIPELR